VNEARLYFGDIAMPAKHFIVQICESSSSKELKYAKVIEVERNITADER
jgi:hypothetical protein